MIGTAVAVLVGAAAAYAAYNTYNGSKLAISKGAGTAKKPVALGMVETLKANAPAGGRAAPLTNIKVTIYGVKMDVGKLPVCTDAKIEQNKTNPTGNCPKGSLIGTGPTTAILGPGNNGSASGAGTFNCDPNINVFNGGPGKQVFYFWVQNATKCAFPTGSTAPYDSTISYAGGNAIINVPLPSDISTKVAGQPNLYSSLITQIITFGKKVNGKVYMAGVGCKSGKRPWSIQFTATNYTPPGGNGKSETQTVKGSSSC
jgi:hypothetical protein